MIATFLKHLCRPAHRPLATANGLRALRTPIRAPQANATYERFVGSVRRGCLAHIRVAVREGQRVARVLRIRKLVMGTPRASTRCSCSTTKPQCSKKARAARLTCA